MKRVTKTNPNGANGTVIDPRQTPFFQYIFDKNSESYLDFVKSAVLAGYSPSYAENLKSSMPEWLSKNLGKAKRLEKAEKNLDKVLDMKTRIPQEVGKKIISIEDPQLLKIQVDVSKFIAETLGKGDYGNDKDETPITRTVNIVFFDGRNNNQHSSYREAEISIPGIIQSKD